MEWYIGGYERLYGCLVWYRVWYGLYQGGVFYVDSSGLRESPHNVYTQLESRSVKRVHLLISSIVKESQKSQRQREYTKAIEMGKWLKRQREIRKGDVYTERQRLKHIQRQKRSVGSWARDRHERTRERKRGREGAERAKNVEMEKGRE